MNRYSISQIVSFTGINSHSLRVWERRYDFIKPRRTETNIRYYTDSELRKLLNVKVLLAHGYKLGKISSFSDEDINKLAFETTEVKTLDNEEVINRLVLAMLELDEISFDKIIRSQIAEKGLQDVVIHMFYPFLIRIGVMWTTKKSTVAEEHFVANLIRQQLIAGINALPIPDNSANKIIMLLPNKEDHELGLLLASFIAKKNGWRVYYLGRKVPINNIDYLIEKLNVDMILTMFTISDKEKIKSHLNLLSEKFKGQIAVAGNVCANNQCALPDSVKYLANPEEFVQLLASFE